MIISHNLASMNANRQLNVNSKKTAKLTEKLASGYKINRAADDAAGLSISEKMRSLIRGLERGTRNAEDGVSWIQTGEGALGEAHAILQRLNELTVQALNGTNSKSDRQAIQQEYEHLQTELDRIGLTTEFNEMNIFDKHLPTYYQCEGAIGWDPEQLHNIEPPRNDFTVKYRLDKENSPQKIITVQVPKGQYTTQELADEIDTALADAGALDDGIFFEFTDDGRCNVNYEGGEVIDSVSGALSYLLYDMYEGGDFGALIGTTSFASGYPLRITSENNNMSFVIQDFNGGSVEKNITIPNGWYYRNELIDLLNNQLQGTSVIATEFGEGIKLGSDDAIVTKFKGNMFKIDDNGSVYTSVFYDNVSYGTVEMGAGYFQGGYIMTSSTKDAEYNKFIITDSNNQLSIKANGMDAPITLTLTNGEHTISEMSNMLNSLFAANGLELESSYKLSGGFYGLKIDSKIEGITSTIDIDPASSAYNTLFIDKKYTQYGSSAVVTNEAKANNVASFTGSKDLSGLGNNPLIITTGVNDAFHINIGNTSTEIRLASGTYKSAQAVAEAINAQLNGTHNITDVEAVVSNNYIKLQGTADSSHKSVSASAILGNDGFDAVIQGYSITYKTTTTSGKGSITLDNPYDGTIEAGDTPLKIKVDGTEYGVNLPIGNTSQEQIIQAIQQAIPGRTEEVNKTFSNTSGQGTTSSKAYSPRSANGNESRPSWEVRDTGKTIMQEGTTQIGYDRPATVTFECTIPASITLTDACNAITLTINGETQKLILANKTYTAESLKKALQDKIDEVYGKDFGGAIVELNGDKISLKARTNATHFGEDTSLYCSTTNSSLLSELGTTRTPAKLQLQLKPASNFTIDSTTNEFIFNKTVNGITEQIKVTLAEKSYTPSTFVAELNSKLANTGVTAKYESGYIQLITDEVGQDVSLSYGTTTGGSSANVIFGPLETKTPASNTIPLDTLSEIVIGDSSNQFKVRVNGTDKTVTLDNGTYDRSGFINMLNTKLASIGLKAEPDGNRIRLISTEAGREQSFLMTYANGGNSMKAIYGSTIINYPSVTASFDANNKLTLSTDANSTISVSSGNGGGFLKSQEIKSALTNTTTPGYFSNTHGKIDGANLYNSTINIDEFADDLQFTFVDEGVNRTISVKVDHGDYSYEQLANKLSELLDAQAGPNKLEVTADASGVVIQTAGVGISNKLLSPSGDFYEKILCNSTERLDKKSVTNIKGTQDVGDVFTVGRKDIVSKGVTVRAGISDTLSMDFTYDGSVYELEIALDPGKYSASQIKAHIQEKLDEELIANGFDAGTIEVGVGNIHTGVVGANDDKAINFSLAKNVAMPGEGAYIIDGIGGNAAFEIFYSTDGELIPAYITGNKNVASGVTLDDDQTELKITTDGVTYDINLEAKEYTSDELLQALNDQLQAAGAPLIAENEGGTIKISYESLGKHIIEIEGSAKNKIFFQEHGENETDAGTRIQLSAEVEDYINIPRTNFSTTLLGLNTICVTKERYASKALERVSDAIQKVSSLRSTFGSVSNRLEHSIRNNENKYENTSAAETRIRDTDMAESMVDYAKQNILLQVNQAMLAQANTIGADVLQLLQ